MTGDVPSPDPSPGGVQWEAMTDMLKPTMPKGVQVRFFEQPDNMLYGVMVTTQVYSQQNVDHGTLAQIQGRASMIDFLTTILVQQLLQLQEELITVALAIEQHLGGQRG